MTRKGLKYHVIDRDRHGNERHYVRLPGRGKLRIRARFQDADGTITREFLASYSDALEQLRLGKPKRVSTLTKPGTFHWLGEEYFRSPEFRAYDPKTQAVKRGILRGFFRTAGDLAFKDYRRADMVKSRDKRRATPGAADNLVKTLSRLFAWAVDQGLATDNPASGVRRIFKSEGHHTWTNAEVDQFRERFPLGTRERLALELLLNVGARRADAVKLGRQHVVDGRIRFRPGKKTSANAEAVSVTILPEFREAMAAGPLGDLAFLVTDRKRPFDAASFGNWFRVACSAAGLDHCSAHGLRKRAASRLAENGATAAELCAIFGWSNLETAMIYIRKAERLRMADNAFARLSDYRDGRLSHSQGPKSDGGTKEGKK